ncbi:unnamed protein product [Owenia fusiformis]|uniref:Uncharacterized protein n=1 Tax=Owenia fusiformis TaxID=6347 RepID=A0A8S4Q8R5_OWEFU|nr:unnamed protein product [Owenia fusiformis]
MLWQSLERAAYLLYLIAIFNGACNACLQIGLNSTVGLLFMDKNEVAFGSLKVWQSMAITVTFIYSPFLCMDIKVYIMFGVLAVGAVCAIVLEVICRREQHSLYKAF